MGERGSGRGEGVGGEWSHLQQVVLEISDMVCPLYRYCGFFRVSGRRASRVCGFFRSPEVIRGLGGCRWRVGVVLLSLRSRPGGVWSAKIWTLIIYHFCSKPISMKFIMSVRFDPKRRTNSAKETRNKWKKRGFLSPK